MLEIYKTNSNNELEQTDTITKGCWINLVAPSQEEISRLTSETSVPADFVTDALDDEEMSRIEREDDNVFIITDYPVITYTDAGFPIYETIPLGMILTSEHFVTISLKDAPVLAEFKNRRVRAFFTYKKTRFALQILTVIASFYLRYLKQINKKIDEVDIQLRDSNLKNNDLYALLALEKSLVYLNTSLKTNKLVLNKILRINYLKMYEEDKDLLEDVMIENTQAIEMAETYSSILSSMMNGFASILNNNLNRVMKFLTSITIILSFPTIVASFYGMNVKHLPLSESYFSFLFTILLSFVLSGITAFIFWKKKYF